MNKKFSTLVASVLLAGAVGTVNAAVPYKSYVNSAALADEAVKAVVNGVAYQISDGENVLVMQEQNDGTMKLVLQNPSDVKVDLLSSLWEVATSDDGEGGVSFIFLNKATGLPLAFGTEGVKENATTANAMGNVSLWKWKSGTAIEGEANFVSYFHKDSAMVLVTNGTSVEAKKIYSKGTDLKTVANKLSADAYVAQPVVLDADALNSMLGLQDPKTGKMKLGFTRDQLNGSDNLWLKDMKAVASTFHSPIMDDQPVYASPEEQAAATAAMVLANAANTAEKVSGAIIDASQGKGYSDAEALVVMTMANAAKGESVAKAIEAVEVKKGEYTTAKEKADAKLAVATSIKEEAAKFNDDPIDGAGTLDKYNTKIESEAPDGTWTNISGKTSGLKNTLKSPFIATGYDLATAQGLTKNRADVYAYVAGEAAKLEFVDLAAYTDYNTAVEGFVVAKQAEYNLTDAEVTALKAVVDIADPTPGSWDEAALTTAKVNANLMSEYASAVSSAAATYALNDVAAINSTETFNAAIDALVIENEKLTEDEITAVKTAMHTANWSSDNATTAGALSLDGYTEAQAVATGNEEVAEASLAAARAVDVATTISSAIVAPSDATEVEKAVYAAIAEAAEGDDIAAAILAAQAVADTYSEAIGTQPGDNSYLSLITKANTDPTKVEYLRVDTAFLTKDAGKKHLAFATGVYKADLKGSDKNSVDAAVQADYNGRYNFKFTYYPTQDSLMIKADGFAHPRTDKYYADMDASEINASRALHAADNNVKLAVLSTDKHHEVTLGDIETIETSKLPTINTRIYLNGSANYERTTLESGVYFFNLVTKDAKKKDNNGKYCVIPYCGEGNYAWEAIESTQRFGAAQDFNHMPRTQWVVEQNEGVDGVQTVKITNREFDDYTSNYIQLYKAGDYYFTMNGDTVAAQKVADKYTTDKYLGYKKFEKAEDYEKFYNLDYLSGIELGNYVNFNGDSAVYVDLKGSKTFIEFVPVSEDTEFGYTSKKANATQLYKAAYKLRVHSEALLTTGNYYVKAGEDGKSYVVTSETNGENPWSYFVLKENNELISEEGDTTCYYALQEVDLKTIEKKDYVADDLSRVGVRDASMAFTIEPTCTEKRVATFAVVDDKTPLYRRLGETLENDGFEDMTTPTAKIYTVNSASKEYLYEDATSKYSAGKGINFLGLECKGINAKSAMFVDTAYVRGNTNMPQYMFVMNPQIVKADTVWCNATSTHKHATLADSLACPHTTITPASITGRYLINAQDSVNAGDKNYVWNSKYTRLAFVDAKHIGDTLVIFRNGKPSTAKADSIFLGNNKHNYKNSKNPVFALRLVNTDACDFLIETVGDHKIPSEKEGAWVAVKNGVPVVAAYDTYSDAIRDAEIFNIESTDEFATSTDAIEAGEVSVIATEGAVIVKGAAGKNVVITNVLGQTIANTMVNSSEATISAPAGVVVVAIEGEAAVKAIVK